MINLNWNKFNEGRIAVKCRTEVEADKFLKECKERGYVWGGGTSLQDFNNWNWHKSETCYRGTDSKRLVYCDVNYYERERNVEIVEFTDIIKESEESNDMGKLIKQLKKIMNDTEIDVVRAKGIMIVTDEKIIKGL